MCSELEPSRNCARDNFEHKRDSAELNRLLDDEKMVSDEQDFFVGLDNRTIGLSIIRSARPNRLTCDYARKTCSGVVSV
jgi:hypothetical protein